MPAPTSAQVDFTAKLQEADTSTPGDFTDVASGDLLGSFPASLAAAAVTKVGYRGHKRYVRTVITEHSGTSIAAGAVIIKATRVSASSPDEDAKRSNS